jgi:hypothetical protein
MRPPPKPKELDRADGGPLARLHCNADARHVSDAHETVMCLSLEEYGNIIYGHIRCVEQWFCRFKNGA